MTNDGKNPGRIDLRPLADDARFGNFDRVIGAVHEWRERRRPDHEGAGSIVFASLVLHARPLAAAAALLIVLSGVALAYSSRLPAAAPQQTLATWVQSNHVPTNGELLSTFEGYGR